MRRLILPWVALVLVLALADLRGGTVGPEQFRMSWGGDPERDARLAEIVVEAARRGPIPPVPLFGEGDRPVGALYDQFRVGVLAARARLADGLPIDPETIASDAAFRQRTYVIVAYPIDCVGRHNRPVDIRLVRSPGPAAVPVGPAVRGHEAAALLPGLALPPDSLARGVRDLVPLNETIEIDYEGPACQGAARTAILPLQFTPPRALLHSFNGVPLPAEQASLPSPSTVRVEMLVGADGRVHFPSQVQGPAELGPAAIALVTERPFEAFLLNGEGIPTWTTVTFVFTADGQPGAAEPFGPPPFRPPPGTSRAELVTSTTQLVQVPMSVPAAPLPPVPPAPAEQTDRHLAQLALEVAGRDGLQPIPLDAAGPPVHGLLFDRFHLGVFKARALMDVGTTPEAPPEPLPALVRNPAVVVAFPLRCGDRMVMPVDIALSRGGTSPGVVRPSGSSLGGQDLADLLPGVTLPEGAMGQAFVSAPVGQNIEVRISYAEPLCGGEPRTAVLPIQWLRGTALPRQTFTKLPEGSSLPSPTVVRIRGLVDLEGRYRFPTLADGPEALASAAIALAGRWRFSPYRANGVPIPQVVITRVTFTASGAPDPVPPPVRGPLTTSTVGGRPAPEFSTADVAGLSAATSRCAISDQDLYGYSEAGAIGVGGSFTEGPARARRYLGALRGPEGQGLHVIRRGTTMAPDRTTILDIYEVTYAGITRPLHLFVDQYHTTPLLAPKGLVCAEAVDGR